jgi:exopolysaccharide biosynthesis protein
VRGENFVWVCFRKRQTFLFVLVALISTAGLGCSLSQEKQASPAPKAADSNPEASVTQAPAPTPSPEKPSFSVKVETIETPHFTAKVMKVTDPTTIHLVKTKYESKGQPLSDLITENNGVAGINAGGFEDSTGRGSGGELIGIAISDGKVISTPNGSYDKRLLVGGFTSSGEFVTGNYSTNELINKGVTQAVSFGPQLIKDGQNVVSSAVNQRYGWAPRTAIGQASDGTVVMIITDGRFYFDKRHRGADMDDMARLMLDQHVTNAIALDGGGSTTMIKDGKLQLQPATSTAVGMRYLPTAFIVVPHS